VDGQRVNTGEVHQKQDPVKKTETVVETGQNMTERGGRWSGATGKDLRAGLGCVAHDQKKKKGFEVGATTSSGFVPGAKKQHG